MNKKTEALKLALKALNRGESQLRWEAIAAIEEALAQPAQHLADDIEWEEDALEQLAQPEQEQEQSGFFIRAAMRAHSDCSDYTTPPAQPEQEPVAWHNKIVGMEVSMDVSTGEDDAHHRVFGRVCEVMLEAFGATNDTILAIEASRNFTTPPKRTWVDLTDDEIEQGCKESWVTEQAFQSAVWWAEAKLKEKNNG